MFSAAKLAYLLIPLFHEVLSFIYLPHMDCLKIKESDRESTPNPLVSGPDACNGSGWAEAAARDGDPKPGSHTDHRNAVLGVRTAASPGVNLQDAGVKRQRWVPHPSTPTQDVVTLTARLMSAPPQTF